jgi:hypothetical protein
MLFLRQNAKQHKFYQKYYLKKLLFFEKFRSHVHAMVMQQEMLLAIG